MIHDRFILTRGEGWIVGSSLKDFGKKLSAVTPLPNESKKEAERIFEEIWGKSKSIV